MPVQCITAARGTSASVVSAFATDDLCNVSGSYGYRSYQTLLLDNMYATMPMVVVQSVCAFAPDARPDEEELHTSFEQAISDRVTAVNSKLRRMVSNPSTPACEVRAHVQARQGMVKRLLHSTSHCQRGLLFGSLALMLLLIGFDLMGLLVLSLH